MIIPEKAVVAVEKLTDEMKEMRKEGGMPLKHEFDNATIFKMSAGIGGFVFVAILLALLFFAKYQYNLNQNTK